MPVVPKVDVYGTGATEKQKQKVHAETYWDDECSNRGIVSHRRCCRPSHVKYFQRKIIDLHHLLECWTEAGSKKSGDYSETYEADTYVKTALERLRKLDADTYSENSKDDWHHDSGAKADDV